LPTIPEGWRQPAKEGIVSLIVYFIGFMLAGDVVAYFIGLFVEYEWGTYASLIVFLALYFGSLWVAWLLAVWVSKPRSAASTAS
jgi:cation transporter-like permease